MFAMVGVFLKHAIKGEKKIFTEIFGNIVHQILFLLAAEREFIPGV